MRLKEIEVDDRQNFDNPLFVGGIKPPYSTWFGLKPYWKFLSHYVNLRKQVLFLELRGKLVGVSVIDGNLIDGFYINPEFRRCGLGGMLMDYTLKFLRQERKCRLVRVGVQSVNANARGFYRKMGFREAELILEKEVN